MSLLFQRLVETYDNNKHLVGQIEHKNNGTEYTLLPIAHTTQVAHVEVLLTYTGEFVRAHVIEGERNTVIPITEASANRTSNIVPHPFHDKLMYVAGDYVEYTGEVKRQNGYFLYLEQLTAWSKTDFACNEVKALLNYIEKGCLIEDLIKEKILHVDEKRQLLKKWNGSKKDVPALFKVASAQSDTFVRFAFEDNSGSVEVWRSDSFIQNFIEYTLSTITEKDICYVTGEYVPITKLQPAKIRSTGDKAKLISSNSDHKEGYLGRFTDLYDNFTIGYEASHKAHNALKWLITKQGFVLDGRVYLIWSRTNQQPFNFIDFLWKNQTYTEYMEKLDALKSNDDLFVLILDAANIGRLSVLSFKQLKQSEYVEHLKRWGNTCHWIMRSAQTSEYVRMIPSVKELINSIHVASQDNNNDSLFNYYYRYYAELILSGQTIPQSTVKTALAKLGNRHIDYWNQHLAITCALLNHLSEGRIYELGLEKSNDDRSYLFGRLLAVAEVLERSTYTDETMRTTNAERYTAQYMNRPADTWKLLQTRLLPYEKKLGKRNIYFQKIIEEIYDLFDSKSVSSNNQLGAQFALGYYQQRAELYKKKSTNKEEGKSLNEVKQN